jgi:hypothetical protein
MSYDFTQLSSIADADVQVNVAFPVVDVNDTSTPPANSFGSNKQMTLEQLGQLYLQLAGGTLSGPIIPSVTPLIFGTSMAIDGEDGNVWEVTLTASTGTLATPVNMQDEQPIRVKVNQDGTGGRTLAYSDAWDFGAAGTPTLSAAADATDYIVGVWNAAKSKCCVSFAGGY